MVKVSICNMAGAAGGGLMLKKNHTCVISKKFEILTAELLFHSINLYRRGYISCDKH